jgi:hypothetical protein
MKTWDQTQSKLLWDTYRRTQDVELCARRFNCTVDEAKLRIEELKNESAAKPATAEQPKAEDLLDAVQTVWVNILQKYNDMGGFMKLMSDLLSSNLEDVEVQDEINLMVKTHGVELAGKKFHDKYIVIPRAKLKVLEQPAATPDVAKPAQP